MNIIKSIDQFDINNVFFGQEQKNNVINDSKFIRLLYSTDYFTLNGIFLDITLKCVEIEKYYLKYKLSFNIKDNTAVVNKIKEIEKNILDKISIPNKNKSYELLNQLNKENIKIVGNYKKEYKKNITLQLKLSGIWDNGNEYGITYKFIPI